MPAQGLPARTSLLKPIRVRRIDWQVLVSEVILVAGAIAVYGRTFSVPLLFDDRAAIIDNATIRHWGTAFGPRSTPPRAAGPS